MKKKVDKGREHYTFCPICRSRALMTGWRPGEGTPPLLREFNCWYGHTHYKEIRKEQEVKGC